MSQKGEIAKKYFLEGYNCSQSVLLAFCEECGIDRETACKISVPFGGGLARQRLLCGAVSGMCMVAGLLYGKTAPGVGKSEHYALIQQLFNEFKEINGSLFCGALLKSKGLTTNTSPVAEARSPEYYKKRPCLQCIADAADIVEAYRLKHLTE